MFCSQCANEIRDSDIYCPRCAKPVASFNFSGWNAPQVERIPEHESEAETVVRPKPAGTSPKLRSVSDWLLASIGMAGVAAILCLLALFGAAAIIVLSTDRESVRPKVVTAHSNDSQIVSEREQSAAEALNSLPADTFEMKERAKRETNQMAENAVRQAADDIKRESDRERSLANAVNENPRRSSNSNANVMPYESAVRPPLVDRNGKPLRAICNNGEPSYWEYDRALTCLQKGGVREWFY
jgi:hypothetical protein